MYLPVAARVAGLGQGRVDLESVLFRAAVEGAALLVGFVVVIADVDGGRQGLCGDVAAAEVGAIPLGAGQPQFAGVVVVIAPLQVEVQVPLVGGQPGEIGLGLPLLAVGQVVLHQVRVVDVALVVGGGVDQAGIQQGVVGLRPLVGVGPAVRVQHFQFCREVRPGLDAVAQGVAVFLGVLGGGVFAGILLVLVLEGSLAAQGQPVIHFETADLRGVVVVGVVHREIGAGLVGAIAANVLVTVAIGVVIAVAVLVKDLGIQLFHGAEQQPRVEGAGVHLAAEIVLRYRDGCAQQGIDAVIQVVLVLGGHGVAAIHLQAGSRRKHVLAGEAPAPLVIVRGQPEAADPVGVADVGAEVAVGILPGQYIVLVVKIRIVDAAGEIQALVAVAQAQAGLGGGIVNRRPQQYRVAPALVYVDRPAHIRVAGLFLIGQVGFQLPVLVQAGIQVQEELVALEFLGETVQGFIQGGPVPGVAAAYPVLGQHLVGIAVKGGLAVVVAYLYLGVEAHAQGQLARLAPGQCALAGVQADVGNIALPVIAGAAEILPLQVADDGPALVAEAVVLAEHVVVIAGVGPAQLQRPRGVALPVALRRPVFQPQGRVGLILGLLGKYAAGRQHQATGGAHLVSKAVRALHRVKRAPDGWFDPWIWLWQLRQFLPSMFWLALPPERPSEP